MSTDVDPEMTIPGPAGTQPGSMHGMVWPVMTAAGRLPMSTVGAPGGISISGSAGCGTGGGTGAGGWIGAWQCGEGWSTWSVTRAAGMGMDGLRSAQGGGAVDVNDELLI